MKKDWIVPELTIYGTVEKITQQAPCNKDFGVTDGFTFQGQPVICTS